MTDHRPKPVPAALPLLAFALALAAVPEIAYPGLTTMGLTLAAALTLAVRSRLAWLLLACALGLLVGSEYQKRLAAAHESSLRVPAERFVTVEVVALRSWEAGYEEERRLRASRFDIIEGIDRPESIHEPLLITVQGSPPPFDDRRVLRAEGFLVRHEGRWFLRVKSVDLLRTTGTAHPWHPRFWNRRISERLDAHTTPETAEPLALARALVLGQSDRLPETLRASYRDGGTYHLLVFSGLQIGIAAAFLAWGFRIFRRPVLTDCALVLMAILAPVFAGNEPSVTRASLMIGVWAGARLAGRPTLRANLLFVACGLRLAMHPEELGDAGFALTFAATAGLALTGPALARVLSLQSSGLRAACSGFCAEVGVLPITLYFFGRYVIGGWIVTMLVSPVVVALLFLSAAACALAFIAPESLPMICRALSSGDWLCRQANGIVDDHLRLAGVALPPPFGLVVAVFSAAVALFSVRIDWIRASAVLLLIIPTAVALVATRTRELPQGASLTALDVGQGDSYLLSDGRSTILVDGGGSRRDPRFGERVVIPQLLELGARRLDAVVMSHPHPDHCGGLTSVVLRLEVGEVWMSGRHLHDPCAQTLFEAATRRGVDVVILEKRPRTSVGNLTVRAVLPRLRYKKSPLNNGSVVLVARAGELGVLLTGDIEREAEFVLRDDGEDLRAEVLKVPHHGSRTSGTGPFLDAVDARWAFISSGAGNPYGHPSDEVLERLRSRGVRTLRTDRDGMTTLCLRDGVTEVWRRGPRQ